jgi:hypothetical protein
VLASWPSPTTEAQVRADIRGCPCRRSKGRRIRKGGNQGQRNTAKRVGVTKIGSFYTSHEELYDGPTRTEVKTGADNIEAK